MDGDEEPRSGGVVTLGGVPEGDDGVSVDPRTEAPSSDAEPADETSADGPEPDAVAGPAPDVAAEAEPDAVAVPEPGVAAVAESDDVVSESGDAPSESDDARAADPDPDIIDPIDARPADAHPVDAPAAAVRSPRRTYVRRGLAATAVALVVALSVSAFAMVGPTTVNVDQRFVDTARTQGHAVASGDQEMLLVSAAHKICDRREDHSTAALRRATALSPEELGAIQQTFTTDVRGFTALALDTYCPN